MYSANPPYQCPSTPLAPRNPLTYKPLNSSPLTCSSDWSKSSPVAAAHNRRRSQYKTLTPNTPTRVFSNSRRSSGRLFTDGGGGGGGLIMTPPARPDSQKLSLRNRFKARCFERAAKAREKAIKGKRYANQLGSDDFMDYDDDDEDEEDIMQDEIFRRIMANATRKEHHSYRISYAQEVGSSIDPDLEDVASWEQELAVSRSASLHSTTMAPREVEQQQQLTPIDLDDEELAAYAEECAALADFDDIPEEELFSWSDFEEPDDEHGYDMDIA